MNFSVKTTTISGATLIPYKGHLGFHNTYEQAKHSFICEGMKHNIHTFVEKYDICQRNKGDTVKTPKDYNHFQYLPLSRWMFPWTLLWVIQN